MLKSRTYRFTVINWETGKTCIKDLQLEVGPLATSLWKQACKLLVEFQDFSRNGFEVEGYQIVVLNTDDTNYTIDTPVWRFLEEMADYMRMELEF